MAVRRATVYPVTLGCPKNIVDSEVMLGVLAESGFELASSPEEADVILINTCSFLQDAAQESIDAILEYSRYKKDGRCRELVVAGCMVERYGAELRKELPEVDRFIRVDEILKVGEPLSCGNLAEPKQLPHVVFDSAPRMRTGALHTAFVKIAEGCDKPCAFCIIPKLRGSFRSRSLDSVVSEVSHLLSQGVRELNLVAQDSTSYGSDILANEDGKVTLARLLEALSQCKAREGDFWIRLLYGFPTSVTGELIKVIRDSSSVCKYLDLPLQHISDAVLRRMLRPLGERGTRELVERICAEVPGIALRTTFMLGFPGETEEDVSRLEKFISEGWFTHVGVFAYSPEPESRAYSLGDNVTDAEKQERLERLVAAQRDVVAARNQSLLGKTVRVLVDGLHPESDMLIAARSEWQAPETDGMFIINEISDSAALAIGEDVDAANAARVLAGRFADVEVTEIGDYDLVGTLTQIEARGGCKTSCACGE